MLIRGELYDGSTFTGFDVIELMDPGKYPGDFDVDNDVDGTDAKKFRKDFGRSELRNPCNNENPCNGDLDSDTDVDGSDADVFKSNFGRSPINKSCPRRTVTTTTTPTTTTTTPITTTTSISTTTIPLPTTTTTSIWGSPIVVITYPQPNSMCCSEPCYDPPGLSDPESLDFYGTASDDQTIVRVLWFNSANVASGVASGTSNWFAPVPIVCGDCNIITVTAEDNDGNISTDTLAINTEPCEPGGVIIE